jgi:hypothetical protein
MLAFDDLYSLRIVKVNTLPSCNSNRSETCDLVRDTVHPEAWENPKFINSLYISS